jgi:putative sterol carrier protein
MPRRIDQEAVVADKYEFLSDEWFDAAGKLIAEHSGDGPPPPNLVMNMEIAAGDKTTQFHMGAKDGATLFGKGHIDGADLTMSTDIDTAKAVFVSGDQQAGMQAFMAGKIKVQGDMTKMMALQSGAPDPVQAEIAEKIKEITADA